MEGKRVENGKMPKGKALSFVPEKSFLTGTAKVSLRSTGSTYEAVFIVLETSFGKGG